MKRLILTVLCVVFILGSFVACGSEQTANTVKLCTLVTKNGEITNTYDYDDSGNLIEWYIPSEVKRYLFEYDENGQMISNSIMVKEKETKRFEYKYDGVKVSEKIKITLNMNNGEEIGREVYRYSYDGQNRTEEVYYKGGVESSRTLFRYDDNGKVVEKIIYLDGSNTPREKYRYENGLQVEAVKYLPEGGIESHSIVKNGFEESYKYDFNGELWQSVTGEYDDKGNVTASLLYSHGKTVKIKGWKYNSNGQVIEETEYSDDGKPSVITVQKYDENGNNIETLITYKALGKTEKTVRQFDANGKKIKQHTTYEGSDNRSQSSEYNAETDEIIKITYKADGTEMIRTVYKQKEGKTVQETSYHEGVEQKSKKNYYDVHGNLLKTEYAEKGNVTTSVENRNTEKLIPKEQLERVEEQKHTAEVNDK